MQCGLPQNFFGSESRKKRNDDLLTTVFLIARETGWGKETILNLPIEEFNHYSNLVNEIYGD